MPRRFQRRSFAPRATPQQQRAVDELADAVRRVREESVARAKEKFPICDRCGRVQPREHACDVAKSGESAVYNITPPS